MQGIKHLRSGQNQNFLWLTSHANFHSGSGSMLVLCVLGSAKNQLSFLHQFVWCYHLMNLHTNDEH